MPTGGGLFFRSRRQAAFDPGTKESLARGAEFGEPALPARIALPALLGNAVHEQQLEAALKENDSSRARKIQSRPRSGTEKFRFIPGENGFVQFSYENASKRIS